ncbi:unnamed protein product [Tilletia controversa]|nr:unnamed protein product [Tilletia controversa]
MKLLALALAAVGLLANNAVDASNSHSKRSITARAASTVQLPGGSTVAIGTKRKETTFTTSSKDDSFIKSSVISILAPLPARANVTVPAECEYLSYLRYRHTSGPSKSMSADRVLSFMPGTLAGAASFDQMARNIIFESKKLGQNVEVWSLARRASCLTDTYGLLQGVQQKDAQVTVDYYYNNKTVNGKKFVGFLPNKDDRLDFLAYQGVDQTTKDWHDLILKEIPDQTFRTTKHYASGHSLGGLLTAYFANYDADGNIATTADAGFNQAAGFLAFDSVVRASTAANQSTDPFSSFAAANQSFANAQKARVAGTGARSLFTLLPIILTEDLAYYALTLGVIASTLPDAEVPASLKPRTIGVKTAVQASFSTDLVGYLVNGVSGLISWYDTQGGLGKPFVNSSVETTDIDDFARSLSELPLPYIETYYPSRVTSDTNDALDGASEAVTINNHPEGYTKRPVINLIGSEGLALKRIIASDNVVIAPGYNHLDTISASRKQNLGRQELVSINAAKFISVLGTGVIA